MKYFCENPIHLLHDIHCKNSYLLPTVQDLVENEGEPDTSNIEL